MSLYKKSIANFVEQEESGFNTKEMIQTILPKCFLALNDCLSRILRENGVVRAEEKQSDERTQLIVRAVMDLQNRYLSEKPQERQEIRAIIRSMKPEIE
jgi:hypothetical protein